MQIFAAQTQLVLDLVGVFFFAVSGALLAARKGFDVVGSVLLAGMTGLGGGVIRDLIIGVPPAAFDRPIHILPVALAAAVVYLYFPHVSRFRRTLLLFDAAGLGLFCVTGTVRALDAGVPTVSAALLGVTTAVGGGLLRDVVAREVPSLFRHDDIYAVPAMVGAAATALLWRLDALSLWTGVAASVATFTLRALAVRYGWRAPLAYRRLSP
ncbi:trimeric intracellular cation channel family protein [Jiangella gansuensis]|uniref:trimeric intracellular cation channel family protein n=1 Tax=Jiangella gansuensis TaxID=281473 RepID=UPI0004786AE6|nr:trimeric intracellular cation channel family protein [Jiangella gansuensis]